MTPAELWHAAVTNIEIAQVAFLDDDQIGAQTAAAISLACSNALLARPPSRARASTFGEYDHDATVMDREEIWHHDEDRRQRDLRDARD